MISRIKDYFQSVGAKRIIIMVIGNIFLGMGISIFKLSSMGNDPCTGMIMALSEVVHISYPRFMIVVSSLLFIIQLRTGRSFIGIGTFVNAIFLGYIVTFFYNIWISLSFIPQLLWQKLIVVCVGVIVCSFGISLYQKPNVGASPYDSMSLILAKRQSKFSYFWCRMLTDSICSLICFLSGGIVGIGTLISAFGFGPIIHFFDIHVSNKLLGESKL